MVPQIIQTCLRKSVIYVSWCFFVLFLPDVLHVFFDLTIFQHQKNWRQNCPRVAVGRWDSRLELLTRYTAQLKGPRHPQFMQGARDTQIPVSKNQVELGGLTFDDICWIFLERMFFQSWHFIYTHLHDIFKKIIWLWVIYYLYILYYIYVTFLRYLENRQWIVNIVKLCEILSKWCFKLSRISVALQPRCWQKFDKFSWPTSWGRQDPKSKPITKLLTPKIGKKESLIHGENPKNQALCLGETGLPEHWRTAKQPETLIIRTKRTKRIGCHTGRALDQINSTPSSSLYTQGKVEKCRKKCQRIN